MKSFKTLSLITLKIELNSKIQSAPLKRSCRFPYAYILTKIATIDFTTMMSSTEHFSFQIFWNTDEKDTIL